MKYDRILVCGSRTWRGYKIIARKLEKYAHEDTVIITGKAPGADFPLAEWQGGLNAQSTITWASRLDGRLKARRLVRSETNEC